MFLFHSEFQDYRCQFIPPSCIGPRVPGGMPLSLPSRFKRFMKNDRKLRLLTYLHPDGGCLFIFVVTSSQGISRCIIIRSSHMSYSQGNDCSRASQHCRWLLSRSLRFRCLGANQCSCYCRNEISGKPIGKSGQVTCHHPWDHQCCLTVKSHYNIVFFV